MMQSSLAAMTTQKFEDISIPVRENGIKSLHELIVWRKIELSRRNCHQEVENTLKLIADGINNLLEDQGLSERIQNLQQQLAEDEALGGEIWNR